MALGWHGWQPARFLGLLVICLASTFLLATWDNESEAFSTIDDLTTIKDSIGSAAERNDSSLRKNAYQLDPPPEQPPYGAVIAAARLSDELGWMAFFRQKYVRCAEKLPSIGATAHADVVLT